MKRLLIVLLLASLGLGAEAQTMLKVSMTDNTRINVSLDGRYFNKGGTSVTVGDLPAGRHLLKIYVMSQDRRGRGVEDIVYEGKVKTHDGMVTILQYDPGTQGIRVDEQDINTFRNDHPAIAPQQTDENNTANNGNSTNENNNQTDNQPVASPVVGGTLDDAKIDNLKTTVITKSTDTERMKEMKAVLENETFTTYQVSVMMDWFNFESSKVDFAEWCYPKAVDKEVYTDLENKLTYKNYRDDLDKFIKSKQ